MQDSPNDQVVQRAHRVPAPHWEAVPEVVFPDRTQQRRYEQRKMQQSQQRNAQCTGELSEVVALGRLHASHCRVQRAAKNESGGANAHAVGTIAESHHV